MPVIITPFQFIKSGSVTISAVVIVYKTMFAKIIQTRRAQMYFAGLLVATSKIWPLNKKKKG